MSHAVVTGLFTLGGVLAGGLITAAVEGWRDRRNRRVESRAAARLVQEEARRNKAAIARVREIEGSTRDKLDDLQDSIARALITNRAWSEHAGLLARGLSDDEWRQVQSAYAGVRLIMTVRSEDRERVEQFSEETTMSGLLEDVEQKLDRATEALTARALPARRRS